MLDRSPTCHWLIAVVACTALGALSLLGEPAAAQNSTPAGRAAGGVGADEYRFEDTATHVRILGAARISGEEDQLAVTLRIDEGFHINANPASDDYLIPTTLTITELVPLRVAYPGAVRFKPKFVDQSIDVYDGTVLITAGLARSP